MATGTTQAEAIAAIFPDESHARMAMRELDKLGFKHAWIGIIRSGEGFDYLPIVESADGGGVFEAIGRVFGGEGDRPLHTVLTSHGISTEQARLLASRVRPYNAVLTVDVEDVPERAIETIEAHGGDVGRPGVKRSERNVGLFDPSAVFL